MKVLKKATLKGKSIPLNIKCTNITNKPNIILLAHVYIVFVYRFCNNKSVYKNLSKAHSVHVFIWEDEKAEHSSRAPF